MPLGFDKFSSRLSRKQPYQRDQGRIKIRHILRSLVVDRIDNQTSPLVCRSFGDSQVAAFSAAERATAPPRIFASGVDERKRDSWNICTVRIDCWRAAESGLVDWRKLAKISVAELLAGFGATFNIVCQ